MMLLRWGGAGFVRPFSCALCLLSAGGKALQVAGYTVKMIVQVTVFFMFFGGSFVVNFYHLVRGYIIFTSVLVLVYMDCDQAASRMESIRAKKKTTFL